MVKKILCGVLVLVATGVMVWQISLKEEITTENADTLAYDTIPVKDQKALDSLIQSDTTLEIKVFSE